MSQKIVNFLSLALEDYLAARLLLRQGLLAQGLVLASTSVEKQLKAILGIHGIFTKKDHLDLSLLSKVIKVEPKLSEVLNRDFIKFLGNGFMLRYASTKSENFGIVINQHRTLIELDFTVLNIDKGIWLENSGKPQKTPTKNAIDTKNPILFADNVALGDVTLEEMHERPNKMYELKIGKNLQTASVHYDTEGLNIIGDFCKKTDIALGKEKWQLALG